MGENVSATSYKLKLQTSKEFQIKYMIATFFELHNTRNNSQCLKEERHSKPNIHIF
jgi:hypothetical protein